jgi:hypothetical protein
MKHGPYKADPDNGCEEICYWRYPRKAEKGPKILPTTMRKSSGLSAVSPPNKMEQLALETPPAEEEPQETKQSIESGDSTHLGAPPQVYDHMCCSDVGDGEVGCVCDVDFDTGAYDRLLSHHLVPERSLDSLMPFLDRASSSIEQDMDPCKIYFWLAGM